MLYPVEEKNVVCPVQELHVRCRRIPVQDPISDVPHSIPSATATSAMYVQQRLTGDPCSTPLTASSIQSLARHSPNRHAPTAGTSAARAAAEKTFRDSTTPMNVRGSMLRRSTLLINRRWSVAFVSESRRREEPRAKEGTSVAVLTECREA